MQIREIHVDRFGILNNRHVVPVSPGLNVVFGKNEFGKTTLLEFVRWVLFGFEKKRKGVNSYDPVTGGEHSGSLVCEKNNGERIIISRKGGTLEGQVTVQAAEREGSGQGHLEEYLGHASRKIFKNIYAFALDELQELDSLLEEEIKNKILGAGMGLGQVSLTQVEKEFRARQDELFKPRGTNPGINRLYQEIKDTEEALRSHSSEVERYDELNKKIWVLEQKQKSGESQIKQMESQLRNLELRKELFGDCIELEDWNRKREELAEAPVMEEEQLLAYERIRSRREDLDQRWEEETAKLKSLEIRRGRLTLNPELLKRETQVTQLRQLTELIRAAQEDETRVWQERDQLEEKIQSEMAAFGPDWDETRVRSFQCSEAERKFTQRQANVLANCRQLAGNIKNKLELHREQQVTESSSQSKIPLGIRKFSWLLIGIGFIGAGVALFITDLVLGIFMGLILSAGVGLYIWVSSDKPGRGQEDVLGKMLESKLRKATANQEREIAVWGEWVREKGLDPETTPEGFKEMQAKVLNIQGWLEQKNNLDERLGRMRGKEEEAEQLVAALSEYVDKEDLTGDLPARIEFLCRQFDETKERSVQFRDLEAQLEEQKLRVQGLGEQLQSLRESLDRLLETSGASSEDNFLHQWNLSQKRSTAEKTIREIEKRIQIRVGTGEAFQQFTESMRETQPEQLEQELTCVRSQLNEMHEEHDRINQAIGQARAEADQLASSEDLTRLQNELEAGRERLMNSAREWAAHTLALQLLDKAKHQYEKNRQPQVFQAASRVFSQITGGNYPGVEKPLESDEFRVVQHDGGFKSPVQLSRGTREQLYLSMRFGLIEDYETRAEPLPIVMDDVFVNFDDDRRERVLEILRDFARERQVIILSCHSYLLDTYLKYGAQQVSF